MLHVETQSITLVPTWSRRPVVGLLEQSAGVVPHLHHVDDDETSEEAADRRDDHVRQHAGEPVAGQTDDDAGDDCHELCDEDDDRRDEVPLHGCALLQIVNLAVLE